MAAVAGQVDFIAGGRRYEVGDSVTVSPFNTMREAVTGINGLAGHKIVGRAASVEVELITTPDTLAAVMEGFTGDVSVKCANGRQYVFEDAFVDGEPDFNAIDGKTTIKFIGRCTEV